MNKTEQKTEDKQVVAESLEDVTMSVLNETLGSFIRGFQEPPNTGNIATFKIRKELAGLFSDYRRQTVSLIQNIRKFDQNKSNQAINDFAKECNQWLEKISDWQSSVVGSFNNDGKYVDDVSASQDIATWRKTGQLPPQ